MEMCTKASRIFVVDNWYGLAAGSADGRETSDLIADRK